MKVGVPVWLFIILYKISIGYLREVDPIGAILGHSGGGILLHNGFHKLVPENHDGIQKKILFLYPIMIFWPKWWRAYENHCAVA